ncbi:MAG TPA: S41 family peptidase [Saprospiraceae bacterium]|nr:S41 family peptidase [Saprospiraceae bacterium]MCB9327832.1 S41 family peptidase [Lewinellaceae bacterium]HRX27829.1 S41 family peptidase [Saprospiraceae bacterium]
MIENKKYEIVQPLLLASMVCLGIFLGYKMNDKQDLPFVSEMNISDEYPIGKIEEVVRFVENRYVDSINRNDIYKAAFDAVFSKLDPHSLYIAPEELESINNQMNGNYVGLGVEIYQLNDTVVFTNVTTDSPAQKSGLKIMDRLIAIDGVNVAGQSMAFDSIRGLMKRQINENIKLTVLSGNKKNELDITVDNIQIPSVDKIKTFNDTVAYIKVKRFGSHTYNEFMSQLEPLADEKRLKNLIIDLRGNPGGYLPEAVNMLSQLFDEKELLLVYTEGKKREKVEYKTTGKSFFNIDKIAVLVDENSASASEIVAAAIKEWDRGIIIGRRTFGKGLVQEQYELANGGALRLTVARYYTPSGRSIQKSYGIDLPYEYDLSDRFESGELIHGVQGENSEFETKILHRKLPAGGGVYPDVFVPVDSVNYTELHDSTYLKLYDNSLRFLSMKSDSDYANISLTDYEKLLIEVQSIPFFNNYNSSALKSLFKKLLRREDLENEENKEYIDHAMEYFAGTIKL